MSKTDPGRAAKLLLDAQVKFMIEQWAGDGFQQQAEALIDLALSHAEKLKLKECVDVEAIKQTAHAYAVDMEPGPAVPELVGQIARVLYEHPILDRVSLGDLISDARFRDVMDKSLELHALRERLVNEAVASPIYIAFASDLLFNGIKGYLGNNRLTRMPGAGSMMKLGKSVLNKATSGMEGTLEEQLKKYVSQSVESTSSASARFMLRHLNDDTLAEMCEEIWDRTREIPLADLRDMVSQMDIEELFVTGYEFWREFRHTELYGSLISAGIDVFFARYGDVTLAELLLDLGVTRTMMVNEALRYGPMALKTLKRKKLLDPLFRSQVEGFYQSPQFEKVFSKL